MIRAIILKHYQKKKKKEGKQLDVFSGYFSRCTSCNDHRDIMLINQQRDGKGHNLSISMR